MRISVTPRLLRQLAYAMEHNKIAAECLGIEARTELAVVPRVPFLMDFRVEFKKHPAFYVDDNKTYIERIL